MGSKDWNFNDPKVKKWLGYNWAKAKKSHDEVKNKALKDFKNRYPYADPKEFEFWIDIDPSTGQATLNSINYIGDGEGNLWNLNRTQKSYSYSLDSNTFKYKYTSVLFWGPESGVFQPTSKDPEELKLSEGNLGFDETKFKLYVTKVSYFTTNFPALKTAWKGKENDITKAKVDPYFASLCAAYVPFHKSGICTEHFRMQDGVHPVVTSIFRFYVYYHMRRFLRQPKLLNAYLDANDLKMVKSHIPTKEVWTKKTAYGDKETFSSFYAQKKREGKKVRNAKYYGGGYRGVLGIKYEEVTKVTNQGDDDWRKFVSSTSNGINRRGQLFLQKAIEAFVYCVLGAGVKTRWAITGAEAKSFETQVIFHHLVEETIAQSNDSVMITNMRAAISGSNVLLDLAVVPGVILVPSKLIILDKPIPGYNNVLTVAKQTMKFGVNQDINCKLPGLTLAPKQITGNSLPPLQMRGSVQPVKKISPPRKKKGSPPKEDPPKLNIKTPHARTGHNEYLMWGAIGLTTVIGIAAFSLW